MLVLPADVVVPAAGCSDCFRRASSANVDDDVKTTARAVVGQMAARLREFETAHAALFQSIPRMLSLPGLTGQSSNPCAIGVSETSSQMESGGYWIARSSRAMTVNG
jgi:hypothetical protein